MRAFDIDTQIDEIIEKKKQNSHAVVDGTCQQMQARLLLINIDQLESVAIIHSSIEQMNVHNLIAMHVRF